MPKEEVRMRQLVPALGKIGYYLKVSGNWWDLWLADVSPTIAKIVLEGYQAVYQVLMPIYMSVPRKEDDWLQICNGTFKRWNFPICFEATGGNNIAITKPLNSGSMYYNYKAFFSIVLMATVDYDYSVLAVDVGGHGRISDGGGFCTFCLYPTFKNNEFNLLFLLQLIT